MLRSSEAPLARKRALATPQTARSGQSAYDARACSIRRAALQCYLSSNEIELFPLRGGIFIMKKPLVYIPRKNIDGA
jgi:hypothetical protein